MENYEFFSNLNFFSFFFENFSFVLFVVQVFAGMDVETTRTLTATRDRGTVRATWVGLAQSATLVRISFFFIFLH